MWHVFCSKSFIEAQISMGFFYKYTYSNAYAKCAFQEQVMLEPKK